MATYSPDGRRIVFSAAGHEARPSWLTQAAGLAGILLAAALLMGVVLPLARRFSLPFGALTLIVGLNALMMSVLDDRYVLALAPVSAARPLHDVGDLVSGRPRELQATYSRHYCTACRH